MDYRTAKCNHNQKGMCIHCLVKRGRKQKQQIKMQQQESSSNSTKCTHATNMKCLKCLPSKTKQNLCKHPDYQQCKNCQNYIMYDTFDYYLSQLSQDCKHKKPCSKCVPPLSRKTYSIDKTCRNHMPYPQAQCESCMAPTVSIKKQKYTHVTKVKILTPSIYKIVQTKCIGVLLGTENNGIIQVYDTYFPDDQDEKSGYITPQNLGKYKQIFRYFNLKQVGIIFSAPTLTSISLMISSLFQQYFCQIQNGHQISKFVTMRLQYSKEQDNFQPHFQCFMVSDQFQAFHRNSLIYEKNETNATHFDLITAKHEQKLSQHPTFLRQGVQTDIIQFKQIITWIPTIFEQSSLYDLNSQYTYPYFTIQQQTFDHIQILRDIDIRDSLEKYRNIQFLLHLAKLIGIQSVIIFLNDFYLDQPELFLDEKIKLCEKIQREKQKDFYIWNKQKQNNNKNNNKKYHK